MIQTITNSMRNTFLDCQFKFFCEYMLRLTPVKEASYFRWGRLVHDGRACLDNNEPVEKAIEAMRTEAEEKCYPPPVVQEIDEMCELLPTVLDAHFLRWYEDEQNYEPLGGETVGGKFALELPCGWLFKGKIDQIIRDVRSGRIIVRERKTTSTMDDEFFEDIYLDSQPRGYLLATQRCFGFNALDALYDFFGKPGIREKKWQTREQYIEELKNKYLLDREQLFQRRRMPFAQEDIDAYFWDIDQVAQTIQWHMQEGIWTKHHPRNRLGSCAYKAYCLRGDDSKFYVRPESELNPELA